MSQPKHISFERWTNRETQDLFTKAIGAQRVLVRNDIQQTTQTSADTGRFDLNMNDQYASWIDGFSSVRELVQNWYDRTLEVLGGEPSFVQDIQADMNTRLLYHVRTLQQGNIIASFILEKNLGESTYIELTNFSTVLHRDALTLGFSQKTSKAAAGAYGEGMKVEINRLVARNVDVQVFTGRMHWRFFHEKEGGSSQNKLFLEAKDTGDNCNHHSVCLLAPSKVKLSVPRENYLFMQPPTPKVGDDVLEVLFSEEHHGKVFARGIFVCKSKDIKGLGLNFMAGMKLHKLFDFTRDRDSITVRYLIAWIPILVQSLYYQSEGSQTQRDSTFGKLVQFLYDILAKPDGAGELDSLSDVKILTDSLIQYRDALEGSQWRSDMQEDKAADLSSWGFSENCYDLLADGLVSIFKKQNANVREPYPVCSRVSRSNDVHEAQDAEYFNFNPVEVPEPLYKLLKMSQHCPDVVKLWAKAEEQVYNLPDWVAPNEKAKETAERFRSLGITWFEKALKNTRLVYKCFPPGNQRLVVPGKNQQNERIYAIDMVLLDSPEATHKWVQKQSCSSGKKCIDPKQNETRCGGGCTMLYYSEALKICLQKVVGYSMDLDAMQKIAMMRHQVSDLDAVQILPNPVHSSSDGLNCSANLPHSSEQSPTSLSVQRKSHAPLDKSKQPSSDSSEIETVEEDIPEQKRGVALGESQSNATLLQACFNGTVQQANDPYLSAIRHNGVPASFQFERSHCSGQSAMNLIPLSFPNSVLPLYHEGENVDMAVSLGCNQERARFMSEFAIFIADLARSVFNISDLASCMRVFWEDADRIAFNYGGKLFFNARYAHVQLQTRNPSRYIESYWYVTFCHELAHNVASGHNKDHEFAEEILLVTFMGGLQDFISKRLVKQ